MIGGIRCRGIQSRICYLYRKKEVGRFVPMQCLTRDKTYPKIGTPDLYPVFEVDRTRDRSYPKLVPYDGIYSYFNFLDHQHITYFVSVNVYCKKRVKRSRHTTLD